jgi:hypothetical protein
MAKRTPRKQIYERMYLLGGTVLLKECEYMKKKSF